MMYNEGVCNNESCFMPETKTLIPLYFLTQDNEIKCQYITPLALYKIYHCQKSDDNSEFMRYFMAEHKLSDKFIISYDLDIVKKRCNDENIKVHTKLIQNEHMDTTKLDDRSDLLTDNSKTLYRCIDIYGNIVEVFIPNDKINDKKYWIAQAQQYKLLCDFYYSPFHYSYRDEGLKKVKEEMAKKICGEITAYCFYDTEMEGEYYKCYGIKFPVEETEEKEEKGKDLQTFTSQPLELFKNDFLKVKIYHKEEIKEELKSNRFFHETSFKIGDTEIDLTPSKEEMGRSRSSLEYEVATGYSPTTEDPEIEVITLFDINKIKNYSAATDEDFIARITIDRKTSDDNYGKVTAVQFGKNKKADQPYTAAEARQLLLVNCTKKYKDLAKNAEESFLDLVLRNSDYYISKDCPVRLPDYHKLMTGDWSKEKLKKEVESCTKNFSSNGNIIIPMVKKYPDLTYHMFVIVANKKDDKISFKIFDPSTALRLENKENIKQELGDYIYDNLEEEKNYILSPKERIQNALAEHNPVFDSTCTGISTEYINYIIDNGQDKNPQQLTEEEGKKIQERYAKHVVENGLHHIILGEQQIDTSTLYDHILLYNNGTLKLVKYSDYKKDSKKYKAYNVVCAINGQEIIITSDKDKFNNDIPGITRGVYEDKEEHYKLDYVAFPVYANNRKLELSIFANGETYLYDESLEYSPSVDLTGFDTSLLFNSVSNSIPENSGNTQNDRILLYNNERLKLVKCSDYEKNPKNYGGYQVICTTNGQEFIITSDKDKFNNDIPEIKNGTDKNGEDKDNYVIFPVYVNNRKLYLSIHEDGVTFLMDTKLQENRPVVLTDFDTSLLFNAASNSIPENSSNTPNDRILLYNNERLKLVKCSDYEKKRKNYKGYHVVCTTDGENFIIPSNKGKFNNDILKITNGTVKNGEDKDNYAKFPVLVDNKEFDLFIYEEGITFLIDKENSHKKYYGPVDLTGFDTSPLFKTPSNSILENSSNKSSETVAKSEETKKEVQQVVEESQTTTQAKNTLQEKKTTLENKPQDKSSVKENKTVIEEKPQAQPVVKNEIVDKKEVKPEAVSVAINDTDKKPIKEEITVRNASVEKSKQYFIKTEFVDGKLKMALIEYKEEEHKKDFVKFCNDNHILFTKKVTKEGDKYGCLFAKERAQDIINNKDEILNTPDYIYIYTNNKYINKNDYIEQQKNKEEEQKKKEEEEQKKKETRSIIPALQDINKVQTNEKSEEESGTLSSLSETSKNEGKDNKEREPSSKKDNQDQGQGTVKDSALIKRKGRYK